MITNLDPPLWCGLIETVCERDAAVRVRLASSQTGKRSNSEGDRGKSFGSFAAQAASVAKS